MIAVAAFRPIVVVGTINSEFEAFDPAGIVWLLDQTALMILVWRKFFVWILVMVFTGMRDGIAENGIISPFVPTITEVAMVRMLLYSPAPRKTRDHDLEKNQPTQSNRPFRVSRELCHQ